MKAYKSNCIICNSDLIYKTYNEEFKCYYCGKIFDNNVSCKNNHYVCDECHSSSAFEIVEKYCKTSNSIKPIELVNDLFKHPSVKMHGPEHHFIVPAVMITVINNIKDNQELKVKQLEQIRKRAKNVLGGFCGFYGTCGAAIGTGIFLSVFTEATPLSTNSWKQCNLLTAKALTEIAHAGGPRCCKRDSYIALQKAIEYSNENLGLNIQLDDIKCNFSSLNQQCLKQDCPFYQN